VKVDKDAAEFLATYANGDGRKALNVLEAAASLYKKITVENLKNTLQTPYLRYDQAGDEHYDTISAFIKSMRAYRCRYVLSRPDGGGRGGSALYRPAHGHLRL
jgi:replication-associated recombination protein RarA